MTGMLLYSWCFRYTSSCYINRSFVTIFYLILEKNFAITFTFESWFIIYIYIYILIYFTHFQWYKTKHICRLFYIGQTLCSCPPLPPCRSTTGWFTRNHLPSRILILLHLKYISEHTNQRKNLKCYFYLWRTGFSMYLHFDLSMCTSAPSGEVSSFNLSIYNTKLMPDFRLANHVTVKVSMICQCWWVQTDRGAVW